MKRVIVIVLDSLGIGELPDSHKYGDEGSNTLRHIAENTKGFLFPTLKGLVLDALTVFLIYLNRITRRVLSVKWLKNLLGRIPLQDWELSGLILTKPFPLYRMDSRRSLLMNSKKIGTRTLEINLLRNSYYTGIRRRAYKTGFPIVYTSADSVFQIAA